MTQTGWQKQKAVLIFFAQKTVVEDIKTITISLNIYIYIFNFVSSQRQNAICYLQ